MFNPTLHLFLFPSIKRTGIRAAEVAADTAGDGDFFTVVVAAFRAGETFAGAFKFTGETAFVAFVDWRVGTVVRHAVVAVIPYVFQRFQVMLNIRDGIHIEKENFNELANFLEKNGIPSAELEDLRNALIEDGQPTDKKFGSKVSAWIGNIITKASTGTIDVSVGTIAGILTNAISKYYGLM